MQYLNLSKKDSIDYDKQKYVIKKDAISVSKSGKALVIFSVNKPEPLKLEYNSAEWITSENMRNIINNELIKKLMQTSDSIKDMLLLFGSIGGIIAGIASAVMLLKTYGLIK